MASNAIAGVGTQFRRWNSSLGAWASIAEINSIDWSGMSRATFETTSLDTVGGYRTFKGSFRDPGQIVLNMNFTRDTYEQMLTDFDDDDELSYEIVLPDDDNTSIEFEGLVTELPFTIPGEKVTANTTIKLSGQVTINSGSGPSPG